MSRSESSEGSGAGDDPGDRMHSGLSDDRSAGSGTHCARPLKVALACPGVGLVQRGFERMFDDLFRLLQSDLDVTIYKGGGDKNRTEVVLRFANRNGWIARYLPAHKLAGRTPLHLECLTFGIALLYAIRKQSYDIVHVIDPPLARFLFNVRNRFGLDFRLLYTEGCAMPPGHYPPADHVQQVAESAYLDALRYGLPEDYMTLVPVGLHPERLESEKSRSQLRASYNIDPDTFLILGIGAINRGHKRIDHLINEVAGLDGDFLLWLDGSMDQGEPDLIEFARNRLGSRCLITHVPSEQVGDLLKMADVFVHAAVHESFGLSIVEAATAGLPLLIHNGAHFRWLVPNSACWVDMTEEDALARRLQKLMRDRHSLRALVATEDIRTKYNWKRLKPDYLALYRKVAALPLRQADI